MQDVTDIRVPFSNDFFNDDFSFFNRKLFFYFFNSYLFFFIF